MPTTGRGYPYPTDLDAAEVPADIEALAVAVSDDVQGLADDLTLTRQAFGTRVCLIADKAHANPGSAVAWDTPLGSDLLADPYDFFNPANPTRLTVPAGGSGIYIATTTLAYVQKVGGTRNAEFKVSAGSGGAQPTSSHAAASFAPSTVDATRVPLSTVMWLYAGNYVEVTGFHNSGGNITLEAARSHFALYRIADDD
jgi:hypothetical protein